MTGPATTSDELRHPNPTVADGGRAFFYRVYGFVTYLQISEGGWYSFGHRTNSHVFAMAGTRDGSRQQEPRVTEEGTSPLTHGGDGNALRHASDDFQRPLISSP
ncbi:hypothetical protein D7V97_29915 [Corallococcus sp. CA053C]|nr:hypothetical protein D7V97_29915 [Corallococcus sp. CA053C]